MPVTDPELDNPFWSSLRSRHRTLALAAGEVALTALVYPHYFRKRTMEPGRYFGIHQRESGWRR